MFDIDSTVVQDVPFADSWMWSVPTPAPFVPRANWNVRLP